MFEIKLYKGQRRIGINIAGKKFAIFNFVTLIRLSPSAKIIIEPTQVISFTTAVLKIGESISAKSTIPPCITRTEILANKTPSPNVELIQMMKTSQVLI